MALSLYFGAAILLGMSVSMIGYLMRKAGYRGRPSEFLSISGMLLSRTSIIGITASLTFLLLNGAIHLGWPRGLFPGALGAIFLVGTAFSALILIIAAKRAALGELKVFRR